MSSSTLLPSVPNFRDLGGYPTECGRTVRHGLLYRSAEFSDLSASDVQKLRSLNIRLLCDARSESERVQIPNTWAIEQDLKQLHLNISVDLRANHLSVTNLLSGSPTVENANEAMLVTYELFPSIFASQLAKLLQSILVNEELPLVFHCAAGKDRTGFIAAILLSALGVPRTEIYADYLLTAECWKGAATEAAIRRYLEPICDQEPPIEVIHTLGGVSPAYLDTSFSVIDRDFGGVASYLELIGLHTEGRQRLKDLILI